LTTFKKEFKMEASKGADSAPETTVDDSSQFEKNQKLKP